MGLADVPGTDPAESIIVIVPREKYEVLEDGGLIGLKGSGSNSVVIEDAFVPSHHTAPIAQLMGQSPIIYEMLPGGAIHGNPMYSGFMGFAIG